MKGSEESFNSPPAGSKSNLVFLTCLTPGNDVSLQIYNAKLHSCKLSSAICFLYSNQLSPEHSDRQTTAMFRLLRARSPVEPSDFQILLREETHFFISLKLSPAHNNCVLCPSLIISAAVVSAENTLYRNDGFHKTQNSFNSLENNEVSYNHILLKSCNFNFMRQKENVYHFTLSTRQLPTKSPIELVSAECCFAKRGGRSAHKSPTVSREDRSSNTTSCIPRHIRLAFRRRVGGGFANLRRGVVIEFVSKR